MSRWPDEVTDRQREILAFIVKATRANGSPPTIREIGEAFGIRSTNGVNDHLARLEAKGLLRRGDMKARSLVPTRKGLKVLGEIPRLDVDAVRVLARRVADAYFADVASGSAREFTLANLIESHVLEFMEAA